MKHNYTIIPLQLKLPTDYAHRVGFVKASAAEASKMVPRLKILKFPRFTGYYFLCKQPVALSGEFRVINLRDTHPISVLQAQVAEDPMVNNSYSITSDGDDLEPMYMLVHDTYDGSCTLMSFEMAKKFLLAGSAVFAEIEREY